MVRKCFPNSRPKFDTNRPRAVPSSQDASLSTSCSTTCGGRSSTETDPTKALRLRAYAQTCASDAAPYLHPRLATVVQKGDQDATMRTSIEVSFVVPTRQSGSTVEGK
jgi:hypothetical protein